MKCDAFETRCHEWLDARGSAAHALEHLLERHAEECSECEPVYRKYRALHRAIGAAQALTAVPEGFADRVLDQYRPASLPAPTVWASRRVRWAVAAVTLVALGLSLRGLLVMNRPAERIHVAARTNTAVPRDRPPVRRLSAAFADATEATLELARETSAPAARIGRHVIANASLSPTGELALPVSMAPPSRVLESVGNGVNRGVRPLSGTARHAFGFLIGPAVDRKAAPAPREREA